MYRIIQYKSLHDFYDSNKKLIFSNRLAHYHLIKYFEELNEGRQSIYQSYNIVDDEGGNVIIVWGDSVLYLYSLKWSDTIVDGLQSKIELSKFTKRVIFCGTNDLILALFRKSKLEFEIIKQRLLYECTSTVNLKWQCEGSAYFTEIEFLEEVAEMTYRYGIEEWGHRKDRDLNHARQMILTSLTNNTSCFWWSDGKIRTIASIIDSEAKLPIIGSLYTNPEDRGKGYARCLVHEIAKQLSTGKRAKCAIVSDAIDPVTNKMFQEIGFTVVAAYASVHTLKETL